MRFLFRLVRRSYLVKNFVFMGEKAHFNAAHISPSPVATDALYFRLAFLLLLWFREKKKSSFFLSGLSSWRPFETPFKCYCHRILLKLTNAFFFSIFRFHEWTKKREQRDKRRAVASLQFFFTSFYRIELVAGVPLICVLFVFGSPSSWATEIEQMFYAKLQAICWGER